MTKQKLEKISNKLVWGGIFLSLLIPALGFTSAFLAEHLAGCNVFGNLPSNCTVPILGDILIFGVSFLYISMVTVVPGFLLIAAGGITTIVGLLKYKS